ncbi:MAG TPA: ChaN family lipoprotein, partial [Pseudobdellovibrionaceae bacterium]|nr:ChaN family lipoprotein [Pseudobdellovibrionaceae bacterium]
KLQNVKRVKCIALECFFVEHTEIWKSYLDGKISEHNFLKKIEWNKNWVFPWENYRPIIKWAIRHEIQIFPCNTLKTQNLKSRDAVSASLIQSILLKYKEKNPLILVLYGDLHLANAHLPQKLKNKMKKKLNIVRIFQNIDEIYFEMIKKSKDPQVEVVKKNQNTFCLLGVPPWVKWQSYLMFLEEYFDKDLYESQIEFTDHIVRYIQFLSDELECPISALKCSIYSVQDNHFLDQVRNHFSRTHLKTLEKMVEEGYSFFIPQLHKGYLGRITVNHASGLAMQYFYYELTQSQKLPWTMPHDFTRLIWLEAITYFGSKLVNPKRKTESLKDLKNSLTSMEQEGLGKEALKLALAQRVREIMVMNSGSLRGLTFKPKRKWSYFLAAHMLGTVLGERLYTAYSQNSLKKESILQLILKSIDKPEFNEFYYEILELLESFPVAFKSKNERI